MSSNIKNSWIFVWLDLHITIPEQQMFDHLMPSHTHVGSPGASSPEEWPEGFWIHLRRETLHHPWAACASAQSPLQKTKVDRMDPYAEPNDVRFNKAKCQVLLHWWGCTSNLVLHFESPHYSNDIEVLNIVQRRTIELVKGLAHRSYGE